MVKTQRLMGLHVSTDNLIAPTTVDYRNGVHPSSYICAELAAVRLYVVSV